MNITIIIDKSTFQLLNYSELVLLSNYYKHNITPVLTMEILGDLKKEAEAGKVPPENRVKDFANKLFPIDTVVNKHYKHLLVGDLLGHHPSMDGRPNLHVEKTVVSTSGQKGFLIKETEEEKSIYKWKDSQFTEADHELSQLWRTTTTQENLLQNFKKSLDTAAEVKIRNFQELEKFVSTVLISPDIQKSLLLTVIPNYGIDAETATQIFDRWQLEGEPLIRDFAPFAFHCLKVDCLFLFGLTSNLIGTRPTNTIDLQYLYYLPFCNVFSFNDKVHKNLVPLLLLTYQQFIKGSELKADLSTMVTHLDNLEVKEKKKFKTQPPIIEDSFTFKLWKEYFGYPETSNWNRDVSEEELERMKNKMREFERAIDGASVEIDDGSEPDFMVEVSYLSKDDPCHCGSGKKVIDCCIPEKEFDRIASEYIKKKK